MKKHFITWDLGATKCAAALVEYDVQANIFLCKRQYSLKISSCNSLDELTQHIEHALDIEISQTDAICIGGAGHFDGSVLQHESPYPYPMNFAATAKKFHWPNMAVIHDYAPIVCATFTSYMDIPGNVQRLNSCVTSCSGRRVALGIGTGLGMKDGVLFEDGNFWLGQNEIGHTGIITPPILNKSYQDRHRDLIHFLINRNILQQQEPLTFERILTGQGMVNLFHFCHPTEPDITPEELGSKLRKGFASEVIELFAWYLGLFVGTVQLCFMPEAGIWITGGVILNHLNLFECPEFYHGIEASPSYLQLRNKIPLGVLSNQEHAFVGGAYYALQKLL